MRFSGNRLASKVLVAEARTPRSGVCAPISSFTLHPIGRRVELCGNQVCRNNGLLRKCLSEMGKIGAMKKLQRHVRDGEMQLKIGAYLAASATGVWLVDVDGNARFFDTDGERNN